MEIVEKSGFLEGRHISDYYANYKQDLIEHSYGLTLFDAKPLFLSTIYYLTICIFVLVIEIIFYQRHNIFLYLFPLKTYKCKQVHKIEPVIK